MVKERMNMANLSLNYCIRVASSTSLPLLNLKNWKVKVPGREWNWVNLVQLNKQIIGSKVLAPALGTSFLKQKRIKANISLFSFWFLKRKLLSRILLNQVEHGLSVQVQVVQWIRWLRSSSLKNGTTMVRRQAHSVLGCTTMNECYRAFTCGVVRHHPIVPATNSAMST